VVNRVMNFDRNQDKKVETGELAERMRPLIARGDSNGDGALDQTEILQLARTPESQAQVVQFLPSHYGFANDTGVTSSRMRIEGAIEDLRLTQTRKARALAAVTAYFSTLEQTASASKVPIFVMSREREIVGIVEPLPGDQQAATQAALQRFTDRMNFGETERAELVAAMKDILDEEERGNLTAALQRRPVVSLTSGGTFISAGGVVIRLDTTRAVPTFIQVAP